MDKRVVEWVNVAVYQEYGANYFAVTDIGQSIGSLRVFY